MFPDLVSFKEHDEKIDKTRAEIWTVVPIWQNSALGKSALGENNQSAILHLQTVVFKVNYDIIENCDSRAWWIPVHEYIYWDDKWCQSLTLVHTHWNCLSRCNNSVDHCVKCRMMQKIVKTDCHCSLIF
jgi:hypothetical protein